MVTRSIKRFHSAPGGARLLVCFPHAGGSASFYYPLSRALAADIEVLAIQYPGRQDRLAEKRVEDLGVLAGTLVDDIRPWMSSQPVFFGHSMGALLAFEVARLLERDSSSPPAKVIVSARQLPSRPRLIPHHDGDRRMIAELRTVGGIDPILFQNDEMLDLILPVLRSDYTAVESYRVPRGAMLHCPISAFVGNADPMVTIDDMRAWASHTSSAFEMRIFTGDHFYLNGFPTTFIKALVASFENTGIG